MTLGEMVREIRHSLGMTQEEFGKNVEISGYYVSLLETGRRTVSPRYQDDVYWKIANLACEKPRRVRDLYGALVSACLYSRDPGIHQVISREVLRQFGRGVTSMEGVHGNPSC